MTLKILSWNVRGLNGNSRKMVIKNELKIWKCDVISLQETKIENVDGRLVGDVWRRRDVDWVALGARGTAGGILTMWDSDCFEKIDGWVGNFSVTCILRRKDDGLIWTMTGARKDLWLELEYVKSRWNFPWVIAGDFNTVRFQFERTGTLLNRVRMEDFSD